ncbi:MAG: PKD domain-containing protein [Bacteroidota bacterium]
MIRNLSFFLACLLILLTTPSGAQQLSENFNSGTLPAGWNNSYTSGNGSQWTFSQGAASVTNTAGLLGTAAGPSWLISSSVRPQAGFATLAMTVGYAAINPLGTSEFQVLITTGSATDYPSYTALYSQVRSAFEAGRSGGIRIQIPQQFWGQDCRLAFTQSVSGLLSSDMVKIDDLSLESQPYYSTGSGKMSELNWSMEDGGEAMPVTFGPNSSVVIKSGHTVEMDRNVELFNITISSGGALNSSDLSVIVRGNITNRGNYQGRSSKLWFDGSYRQFLSGEMLFGDLSIFNPSGLEITDGLIRVAGNITLPGGKLITNDKLVLHSDNQGTGSIGEISPTSVSGKITVERFVPAGQTDWRFLASPLAAQTLADLDDDLVTSGFPGSDKPTFSFISAFSYTESRPGAIENGLVAATNITNPMYSGSGYYVYCGDPNQGPGAFTLDFFGNINQGDVQVPLSYTFTSTPAADGFNLVGNPYPSPVNFGAIERFRTGNKYWVYDPLSGNMDMWNQNLGIGLIRTNGSLQSSQGFFVKSSEPGGYVKFTESSKTTGGVPVFLVGGDSKRFISLKLKQSNAKFYDIAAVVIHENAQPGLDDFDNEKINISHPDAPKLAFLAGSAELGLDAVPVLKSGDTVKVLIKARKTAQYIMSLDGISNFGDYYPVLVDLSTNNRYAVDGNLSLTLSLTKNVVNTNFILVFEDRERLTSIPNQCHQDGSGYLEAKGEGNGPWDYTWKNSDGIVVRTSTSSGADRLVSPPAGTYTIEISSSFYGLKVSQLTFIDAPEITYSFTVQHPTCQGRKDGNIILLASGGRGTLRVKWNTGSEEADQIGVGAGIYKVVITDSSGCSVTSADIILNDPDPMNIAIANEPQVPVAGEIVRFQVDTQESLTEFLWDFGDGNKSVDEEPEHIYQQPGTFTVQLKVGNGFCQSSRIKAIEVVANPTSVAENTRKGDFRIWTDGNGNLKLLPDQNYDVFRLTAMDGRVIVEEKGLKTNTLKEVILNTVSNGIYVVTTMVGEKASNWKIQFY